MPLLKNTYTDVSHFFWSLIKDIACLSYEELKETEHFLYFQSILDCRFMLSIGNDVLFFDCVEELFEETYSYLVEYHSDMKEEIYYLEKSLKMFEIFTLTSLLADDFELKL